MTPSIIIPEMAVMLPVKSELSPLESLPTELLEQIFLQSLNVSLPLASSHLSTVLSSNHLKMSIMFKVFSIDSNISSLEHYDELSHILTVGSVDGTYRAIGKLQSRILACRWMTWNFLQLYLENFIVRTLLREFRARNLPWPEGLRASDPKLMRWHGGAPVRESVVRDFVHECLGTGIEIETPSDSHSESDINNYTIGWTINRHFWSPERGGLMLHISICPLTGELTLWRGRQDTTSPDAVEWIKHHWTWALRQFDTKIPVKLLHGPWTEEQLSFLFVLLNVGGAEFDPDNKMYRDIAKKGLTEAIREDNCRAVHLIIEAWTCSRPLSMTWKEASTFRIKPDTEHLKVAVTERGCRRDIVQALLSAQSSDIDHTDTAVLEWAENQREQGDGRGQWLLVLLTENQHRRWTEYGE